MLGGPNPRQAPPVKRPPKSNFQPPKPEVSKYQPAPASKLQRALKPIGNRPVQVIKPLGNPVDNLAQLHPHTAIQMEKHLIEAHQRSSGIARNLYNRAFDPKQSVSTRLSAARLLRDRYAFPVSQKDYLANIAPHVPPHHANDPHHSFFHNLLHGAEDIGKQILTPDSVQSATRSQVLGAVKGATSGLVDSQITRLQHTNDLSHDYLVHELPALLKEVYNANRDRLASQGGGPGDQITADLKAIPHLLDKKTLAASAKSIPNFVEGIVAGPVHAALQPAETIHGLRKDNAAFTKDPVKYLHEQGAVGPVLNAGMVGAGTGRLLGLGAAEGSLGARLAEIMRERPNLRFAQGPTGVHTQDKSGNLFVAAGQHKLDVARGNKDATRGPGYVKPMGPNEVTPLSHDNIGGKNVHLTSTVNKLQQRQIAFEHHVANNEYQQQLAVVKHLFQRELPKNLSKDQWDSALRVAVERGIRTPEQARQFLPQLIERIKADRGTYAQEIKKLYDEARATGGKAGNAKADEILRSHGDNFQHLHLADEIPHLEKLLKNPEVFTPTLGKYADQIRDIGKGTAIKMPRLENKDAEVRRVSAQAHMLGEPFRVEGGKNFRGGAIWHDRPVNVTGFAGKHGGRKYMTVEGSKTAVPLDELKTQKGTKVGGEQKLTYVNRINDLAAGHGLAEPGYFHHAEFHDIKPSAFALGRQKFGAPAQGKETTNHLLTQGAAEHNPKVQEQALAANVKEAKGVNAAAQTADNFRLREYTDEQGRTKQIPDKGLSFAKMKRIKQLPGYENLVPWNPKVYFKEVTGGDTTEVGKSGWHLIPESVNKHMEQSTSGNSGAQRFFSIAKSLQSVAILGFLHPSWPAFRIFHNLGASAVSGVNPLKGFEAARNLTPKQLDQVNAIAGSHSLQYDEKTPRYGSTIAPKTLGDKVRNVATGPSATGKVLRAPGATLRGVAKPAFAIERKQMAHFQRSAAYQMLSKDAKKMVKQHIDGFVGTLGEATDKLLKDPQYQAKLHKRVTDVFGDFHNYPGVHKALSQNLMFYGFLRYATRFVLKDLPFKHPITTNFLYHTGKQNEANTRKVLGLRPGEDLPPGAAAKVYFRDENHKLQEMGFHRLNPFGALPIENADNPAKIATSSLPLIPQEFVQQMMNFDLLRGAAYRVKGKSVAVGPQHFPEVSLADRGRIIAADALKSLAPYRIADNTLAAGRPMGNDSLAFSQRPVDHSRLQEIIYDKLAEQRFKQAGGVFGEIKKAEASFLPTPSGAELSVLKNRAYSGTETARQKVQDEMKLARLPGYKENIGKASARADLERAINKLKKAEQNGANKATIERAIKRLRKTEARF